MRSNYLIPTIALFAGIPTPASATSITTFAITRGGATYVCADLNEMGATSTDAVGSWIEGMFTGMNAANANPKIPSLGNVGHSTTSNGIIGAVKLYCGTHPTLPLTQAVFDTYSEMETRGQ